MFSVLSRSRSANSIRFRAEIRMMPLLIPHILHLKQLLSAAIMYRSFPSLKFLYLPSRSPVFHYCLSTYAGYLQVPLCTDLDQSPACLSTSSSYNSYQRVKKIIISAPSKDVCEHFHLQMCSEKWLFVDKEFNIK